MELPPPPPGFQVVGAAPPPPPPGFNLVAPQAAPAPAKPSLLSDIGDFAKHGISTMVENKPDPEVGEAVEQYALKHGMTPERAKQQRQTIEGRMQRGNVLTLAGPIETAFSPLLGAIRQYGSRPLEEKTGVPKEVSEGFGMIGAATLGLKGLGGKKGAKPAEVPKAAAEAPKPMEPPPPPPGFEPVPAQAPTQITVHPAAPETIKGAAVRFGNKIYEGATHADAAEKAAKAEGITLDQALQNMRDNDGFVTSSGKYVDRHEAKRIAEGGNQITDRAYDNGQRGLMAHQIDVPPPPKGFEPVEAPRTLKPQDMPFEPELGPEGKPSSAGAAASGVTAPPVAAPKPPGVVEAVKNAGRVVEQIFSPETVDAHAKQAVGAIREMGGRAARDTATTEHLLEPAWKKVSALPDVDRLNFLDYVENRSGKYAGAVMKDVELQSLANTLRTEFAKRADRIENLPSREKASFIEDYFPHFWKDPKAAMDVARSHGGMSKQGSGASLRKRTMPTIADGIAAGLEPVTTNPLDATLRYVQSMDRFIASTEVLDAAKANGTVKFVRPQTMGASGHPEGSMKIPEGYAPLKGRGATDATGAQAYAPEGWARVYNNYISRGIHELGEEWGKGYDTARKGSNAITALELGLSGYHMATMMQEGVVNGVANAVGHAVRGRPVKAAGELAKGFYQPIGLALKGKKVQNEYLGIPGGTKEVAEIADLLSAAGGRAKGTQHAPDYEFSSAGSYVTALKRGQLRMQAAADLKDIKGAPVLGTAKVAARNVGRVLSTVAQPIFEKYIPLVKNGAFAENMATWLERNPLATREEKVVTARQVWDSVDNRFGEMVADNVFWEKTLKQIAMLSLRSWSWTFGGVAREIGGGLRDFARAPGKLIRGAKDSSPYEQAWTPKMDYVVALPLTYGALSAVYQYMKTGEPPKDMQDLLGPRTGGVDPATGQPERLLVPGYMKDVFGFYAHPYDEATNKIATAPRKVVELAANKNWRGDPIFSKDENSPPWLEQFWKYASESFGPITLRDMAKGKKVGSNLSTAEKAIGVRNAPRYITDPEGYDSMMKGIKRRDWQKKERFEAKQKSLYEGQ